MILKEHPIKYTATEVRRAITRLEAFEGVNPREFEELSVKTIIEKLKDIYATIPKQFRK